MLFSLYIYILGRLRRPLCILLCGRSRRPIYAPRVVGHAVQSVLLVWSVMPSNVWLSYVVGYAVRLMLIQCGRLCRPSRALSIYIYIYIYFTHVPHLKLNLGGGSLRERLSSATPLALNLKMDISGILTWSVKYQPVCHASSFEHSTLIPRHETYNVN